MSFILDALKKSEVDRKQRGTKFTDIPRNESNLAKPRWIWIIVILLSINFFVLATLVYKVNLPQISKKNSEIESTIIPTNKSFDFGNRAEINEEKILNKDQALKLKKPNQISKDQNSFPLPSYELLPSINEVRSRNKSIPELHLDIHVYSDNPKNRFVFINMIKLKEGSQLIEGPKIIKITHNGVILDNDGYLFSLPRE